MRFRLTVWRPAYPIFRELLERPTVAEEKVEERSLGPRELVEGVDILLERMIKGEIKKFCVEALEGGGQQLHVRA